ncbi:MAG: MerR family DNA-binding transcriptional regulator [Chloroflexi bacterium]|nr:MAG: MerR family DNA-binding transcriptional regulator [Chloroflexota bacterium]
MRETPEPNKPLRTSEVAKAAGVHPNTVRLYEEWGFLPPIPRSANGYRQFSEFHKDQMILARMALHGGWPGRKIRHSALILVRCAATGDLQDALSQAKHHQTLVLVEKECAETAVSILENWIHNKKLDNHTPLLTISQTAKRLDISIDMLRDWERNGLLTPSRHPKNNYRQYGPAEMGRLRVIRTLRLAGYSLLSILRMLLELDHDHSADVRHLLDTPDPEDDIQYATNQWLSTLAHHEKRAANLVTQLTTMVHKYHA